MAIHSSTLAWRFPMDRGAWRATEHRVAKNHTQLKRLSMHACIYKRFVIQKEKKPCSII